MWMRNWGVNYKMNWVRLTSLERTSIQSRLGSKIWEDLQWMKSHMNLFQLSTRCTTRRIMFASISATWSPSTIKMPLCSPWGKSHSDSPSKYLTDSPASSENPSKTKTNSLFKPSSQWLGKNMLALTIPYVSSSQSIQRWERLFWVKMPFLASWLTKTLGISLL